MCWLLILSDTPGAVQNMDAADRRRYYCGGDVVAVMDDAVEPGRKELNNPFFKIVDVPGVSPSEFEDLLEQDEAAPDANGDRALIGMRKKRMTRTGLRAACSVGDRAKFDLGERVALSKGQIIANSRDDRNSR